MSPSYRFVKLLKNRLYPTYQLQAFMADDRTSPRDGLRLAALTTMRWLKTRLGDAAPAVWGDTPAPEQGMWALQITEPDLGSDPGTPNPRRQTVPGRTICGPYPSGEPDRKAGGSA